MKNIFIKLLSTIILFTISCKKENIIIKSTISKTTKTDKLNEYLFSKKVQLFDSKGIGSVLFEISSDDEALLFNYINNPPSLIFNENKLDENTGDINSIAYIELELKPKFNIVTLEIDIPKGFYGYSLINSVQKSSLQKTTY